MEGRAARVCAVAVTAFLCVLSLIEFTALELELEIPVLEVEAVPVLSVDGNLTTTIIDAEYAGKAAFPHVLF